MREARWEQALAQMLEQSRHKLEDLPLARKGALWKVEIAKQLRKQQGASCVVVG